MDKAFFPLAHTFSDSSLLHAYLQLPAADGGEKGSQTYKQNNRQSEGLTIVSPVRSGQVAGWICLRSVATTRLSRTRLLLLLLFGAIHRLVERVDSFTALFQLVQILLLWRGQHLSQKSGIFPIC